MPTFPKHSPSEIRALFPKAMYPEGSIVDVAVIYRGHMFHKGEDSDMRAGNPAEVSPAIAAELGPCNLVAANCKRGDGYRASTDGGRTLYLSADLKTFTREGSLPGSVRGRHGLAPSVTLDTDKTIKAPKLDKNGIQLVGKDGKAVYSEAPNPTFGKEFYIHVDPSTGERDKVYL